MRRGIGLCCFLLIATFAAAATAAAAVTVKVPDLVVPAGTTEVTGIATVTGGTENVLGADSYLQVANGGPGNPRNPPGTPITPIGISDMTLFFPGSVFSLVKADGENSFPADVLSEVFPGEYQIAGIQAIIRAEDTFANINGVDLPLAKFTLRLHDPEPGTYPLVASRVLTAPTLINDDSRDDAVIADLQVIDGSITIVSAESIVPEPGTIVLAGASAMCAIAYALIRRHS